MKYTKETHKRLRFDVLRKPWGNLIDKLKRTTGNSEASICKTATEEYLDKLRKEGKL